MTEKEFVEKAKKLKTQEEAYLWLIRTYMRPLYALVRKIVIDHDDTDEVVQLTFIKAFKYIHTFKGDSKLFTWLYTIARREAFTHMKAQSKMKNMSIDELTVSRMSALSCDNEFYTGDEIQLALQQAVAKLPQRQREIFNMKYFDDLKYSEIARITGLTEGGLKSNYHLAVQNLKGFLNLK